MKARHRRAHIVNCIYMKCPENAFLQKWKANQQVFGPGGKSETCQRTDSRNFYLVMKML